MGKRLTNEEIFEKASLESTRKEFRKNSPRHYSAAKHRGILDEVCSNIPYVRKYRTDEQLRLDALKYSHRTEYQKKDWPSYLCAWKRGILDEICSHMPFVYHYWTDEELKQKTREYKNKSKLRKENSKVYHASHKRGIIDETCAHMGPDKNEPYTYEELALKAKSYETRTELAKKDNGAYQVALNRGVLDEICLHMPKNVTGSQGEKELLEFLQTVGSDFKSTHFGKKYQIDCYSESLKIGVEYNGLYWHSEEGLSKSNRNKKSYHLDKTRYFESIGIRVIHIWEHEWRDRGEQVKDFLKSACGANKIKVGARKCEFKEIASRQSKEFLDRTHIQGSPSNSLFSIGCFYKNQLIGTCSFGRHHRKSGIVTLNRFACLPNHTVVGFLSKASKMAFDRFQTPIVSWADYCKSQAKGYLAAGWIIEEYLKPDYFYFNPKTQRVIGKQSRKKNTAKTPKGMTEREHAEVDGLVRIYDCGKIRLVYDPPFIP
jgi:hypothetical protein